MNREQMIETALLAILDHTTHNGIDCTSSEPTSIDQVARAVLDAILPQVTTVAELEALPDGTVLISDKGFPYWLTAADELPRSALVSAGPFTVVWRP